MRPRPGTPPPFDHSRLAGLIARHRANGLTRHDAAELDALIEDYLARQGTAVVTRTTADVIARGRSW